MSHIGYRQVFGLPDPVRKVAEEIWFGKKELVAKILEISGRRTCCWPPRARRSLVAALVHFGLRMPGQVFMGPSHWRSGSATRSPRHQECPSHQEEDKNLPREPGTHQQSTRTQPALSLPQMDRWRPSQPHLRRSQSLLPQTYTHVTVISWDPVWTSPSSCGGPSKRTGLLVDPRYSVLWEPLWAHQRDLVA